MDVARGESPLTSGSNATDYLFGVLLTWATAGARTSARRREVYRAVILEAK